MRNNVWSKKRGNFEDFFCQVTFSVADPSYVVFFLLKFTSFSVISFCHMSVFDLKQKHLFETDDAVYSAHKS